MGLTLFACKGPHGSGLLSCQCWAVNCWLVDESGDELTGHCWTWWEGPIVGQDTGRLTDNNGRATGRSTNNSITTVVD